MKNKKIFLLIIVFIVFLSPKVFAEEIDLECTSTVPSECGKVLYYNRADFFPEGFHVDPYDKYDGPDGYGKRCGNNKNGIGLCSMGSLQLNGSFQFYQPIVAKYHPDPDDANTLVEKNFFSQIFQLGISDGIYGNYSLKYNFYEGKKYVIAYHFTSDDDYINTAINNYTCNDTGYIPFKFMGYGTVFNYLYTSDNDVNGNIITSKKSDVFEDLRFNVRHGYVKDDNGEYRQTNEIILYIEFVPAHDYKELQFFIGGEEVNSTSVSFISYRGMDSVVPLYYDKFKQEYSTEMYKYWKYVAEIKFTELEVKEVDKFKYSVQEDTKTSCWVDTVENPDNLKKGLKDCKALDIVCHVSNIFTSITKFFDNIFDIVAKIFDFFINIVEKVTNFIKGIFVPSDGYFEKKIDELNKDLEKELGILYFPISLVQRVMQRFADFDGKTDVIHIPSINVPFFGKLTDETTFDLKAFFNSGEIKPIYDIYLIAVWAICSITLVRFCYMKMRQYFGGGLL